MHAPMSPQARSTLVEHLERVLCDPAALGTHVRRLGRGAAAPAVPEWDAHLLQQMLDDGRRLELLTDEELQLLNGDAIALLALGNEITRDWWPAWNEPLASVVRAWREQARLPLPTWEEISAPLAESNRSEAEVGQELAGSLGQLLEHPVDPKGRALVLDWTWTRSRERLEGLGGSQSACATPADARQLVRFRLRAYASRQGQPGSWILTVSGDPPESRGIAITAELTGWGRRHKDRAAPVDLLPGVTDIKLSEYADPTAIFEGWNGGTASMVVSCAGSPPWRVMEHLPGPILDRTFYEVWTEDPVDGLNSCLARLLAVVARQGSIQDNHLVYQALEEAAREVYRRRYVYRDICSLDDFSRLVVKSALRRYRGSFRGKLNKPLLSDPPDAPDPRLSGEHNLATAELRGALAGCMRQLPERQRIVVDLRNSEDLSYRDVADRLGMEEGSARVAFLRALRALAECLTRKGYGPEDLILFDY